MNKLTLLTKVAIRDPNKSIWKKNYHFIKIKIKLILTQLLK